MWMSHTILVPSVTGHTQTLSDKLSRLILLRAGLSWKIMARGKGQGKRARSEQSRSFSSVVFRTRGSRGASDGLPGRSACGRTDREAVRGAPTARARRHVTSPALTLYRHQYVLYLCAALLCYHHSIPTLKIRKAQILYAFFFSYIYSLVL